MDLKKIGTRVYSRTQVSGTPASNDERENCLLEKNPRKQQHIYYYVDLVLNLTQILGRISRFKNVHSGNKCSLKAK